MSQRHASYKSPPNEVKDSSESQRHRRDRALKEQKQRRLQKVDASRQLDLFADLSLGLSDDDNGDESTIVPDGISQFASLLDVSHQKLDLILDTHSKSQNLLDDKGRFRTDSTKRTERKKKASRWANKCMYAELLEMHEDSSRFEMSENVLDDGLPEDLETGWIAVGPIPVGKRCLLVTQQSSGVWGNVPNTVLRSRVMGKTITPPFPAPFPQNSILDCILDENWKVNGLLHVLDVIRWKGQNIAECEASFRFWWRDTRLAEISNSSFEIIEGVLLKSGYNHIKHPTVFAPIPYSCSTTYNAFLSDIIPRAVSTRLSHVRLPKINEQEVDKSVGDAMQVDGEGMALQSSPVEIRSDGLLLYVTQASYEPGSSPLSCWVPLAPLTRNASSDILEGPLAQFERLIKRRIQQRR